MNHDSPVFWVAHGDGWLVIWRGAPCFGNTDAERKRNYFPRVLCVCASAEDAADMVSAVEVFIDFYASLDATNEVLRFG